MHVLASASSEMLWAPYLRLVRWARSLARSLAKR